MTPRSIPVPALPHRQLRPPDPSDGCGGPWQCPFVVGEVLEPSPNARRPTGDLLVPQGAGLLHPSPEARRPRALGSRRPDRCPLAFPTWYDNNTLLYDKSGGDQSFKAYIKVADTDVSVATPVETWLTCDDDTCFKDKNVHQTPGLTTLGTASPAIVGINGGAEGADNPGDYTKPRVTNTLAPGDCWNKTSLSSQILLPAEMGNLKGHRPPPRNGTALLPLVDRR